MGKSSKLIKDHMGLFLTKTSTYGKMIVKHSLKP